MLTQLHNEMVRQNKTKAEVIHAIVDQVLPLVGGNAEAAKVLSWDIYKELCKSGI